MVNMLIRDLPDEVHRTLKERAEREGRSLQAYVADQLAALAAKPTRQEWLARVGSRRGGGGTTNEEAAAAVEAGRRY